MTESEFLQAIDAAGEWLAIAGVEAVADGEDNGESVIEVGCSVAPSELVDRIPEEFRGFRVVLKYWGTISAQGPE